MRLRLCRRGVYASQSFILLLCTYLYVPRPERELELPLTGACLAHKNLGAETARTHNTHTRCVKSCDACFYFALRQMPHRVPIPPVAKQATRSGPAAGKIARARCTLGGSCEARGVPDASCLGAARRKKKRNHRAGEQSRTASAEPVCRILFFGCKLGSTWPAPAPLVRVSGPFSGGPRTRQPAAQQISLKMLWFYHFKVSQLHSQLRSSGRSALAAVDHLRAQNRNVKKYVAVDGY